MSLQYSILHSKGYVTTCKINNRSNTICNIMLTFNAARKLHLESTTHLFLVNILPVKFWGITPFFSHNCQNRSGAPLPFTLLPWKLCLGEKKTWYVFYYWNQTICLSFHKLNIYHKYIKLSVTSTPMGS